VAVALDLKDEVDEPVGLERIVKAQGRALGDFCAYVGDDLELAPAGRVPLPFGRHFPGESRVALREGDSRLEGDDDGPEEDLFLEDASLFDLLTAFKKALDEMPKVTVHQVNIIRVTLEDQVRYIFRQIAERPYVLFREVCQPLQSKMELIVTFMAMLDLLRLQFLSAKQSDIFGEIRLVVLLPLKVL